MNINFSELIKNTYVRAALVVAAIAIVFTLLGYGGEAGETVAQTNDQESISSCIQFQLGRPPTMRLLPKRRSRGCGRG